MLIQIDYRATFSRNSNFHWLSILYDSHSRFLDSFIFLFPFDNEYLFHFWLCLLIKFVFIGFDYSDLIVGTSDSQSSELIYFVKMVLMSI